MQQLDWNDIRAFVALAETGKLTSAGRITGTDPTTVGRRIKRLEGTLGIIAFERTRYGQSLTEAGERLLAKAETMASAARTIEDSTDNRKGLSGVLRISVSEGFGSQFLTRFLPRLSSGHPNLTIDLVANSGFLSPSRKEADIAVMLSRPNSGPILCHKLADYSLGLFASEEYLSSNGIPTSPEDLTSGHVLVGYVPDLVYAPELSYLNEFHPGLVAVIRSSSIVAQQRLLREGTGIGVLPCFMGNTVPELKRLLPNRSITRSFWTVTHRDTHNLAKVKVARGWLEECVRSGLGLLKDGDTSNSISDR
ncbi:LysR family transcriptional regulator [Erythrobacter westpacificensis]|uniref:LysR family transcriptional regulator n=1 Tax=Erythrobacter westpacificensis TaxID=1055231 RepID=A0ABP9KUF1_9SPHN